MTSNRNNTNQPKQRKQNKQRKNAPRQQRATGTRPPVTFSSRDTATSVVRMPAAPLFGSRSKMVMLPYFDSAQVSTGTITAGSYLFSANGLYDPNITGTGAQPGGFDQMMLFFEHYTVFRTEVVCVYRNQSTTLPVTVVLALRASNSATSDIATVMESGNCISTKLQIAPNEGSIKELRMSVDIARHTGVPDLLEDPEVRGDLAANPIEQQYIHVQAFNTETAGSVNVWFEIRINYYAIFTETRIITPSLGRKLKSVLLSEQKQ